MLNQTKMKDDCSYLVIQFEHFYLSDRNLFRYTVFNLKENKYNSHLKTLLIQFLCNSLRSHGLILTPAVRETVVSGGTLRTVSANHVGPTRALTTERMACIALRSSLMAATWYSAVIEISRKRCG